MKYEVYVQEKLISTVEDKSVREILKSISAKIADGTISVDATKPHNIQIVPVN